MASKPLYIIGAGGHARVIKDMISQIPEWTFAGFVDKTAGADGSQIIAEDAFLETLEQEPEDISLVIGIGENVTRKTLYQKFKGKGAAFPTIISPHTHVSDAATIGEGTVIMPGAIVNVGADIGDVSVINSGAIIEHDVKSGAYFSAAPGAVICGDSVIGEGSYIGANATISHSLSIGQWCAIGAGSVVHHNIDDFIVAFGVPAKPMRQKTEDNTIL